MPGSVEVIIPVCEPDRRLYVLLNRLKAQTVPPDSIKIMLTVTDRFGELDLIRGLAKFGIKLPYLAVDTVEQKDFSHGGTRQRAADCSKAAYCLFMTQDALPKDRFLIEKLCTGFSKKDVAVCYARQVPYKNALLKEKFAREFNYPPGEPLLKDRRMLEAGNIKAVFCSDVCAMYDMAVFKGLGGFDKDLRFNEDMIYAHKALMNNYRICYCPQALVCHSHNLSLKEQFGRNKVLAMSQKAHPEVFSKLSSESEGMIYVKDGLKYMLKNGTVLDAISFIADCGFRFVGFRVGKML